MELKFTRSSKVSAKDFLMRVDECRIFSPLWDIELVRELTLLLTGVALQCYRLKKSQWTSWSTFRMALRSRFGDDNFGRRVRDQIRVRTRGAKQKLEDYLTCLLGLYDKLDGLNVIEEQLHNVRRGLRPEFRRVIKRKDITDFEDLAQIGKDWEAECATMRDYTPPPPPPPPPPAGNVICTGICV